MILSVAMCRLGQDVETFWIEVISYHFSSEKFLLTGRENCNFSCVSTLYFLLYTLGKSIIHPIKDVLFLYLRSMVAKFKLYMTHTSA